MFSQVFWYFQFIVKLRAFKHLVFTEVHNLVVCNIVNIFVEQVHMPPLYIPDYNSGLPTNILLMLFSQAVLGILTM